MTVSAPPDGPRPGLGVWFEAPRQIRVRRESCPPPGPGEVRVRTSFAAISTGTELAAWRGELEPELARDDTLGALSEGGFRFPFQYGYASVGRVEDAGPLPAGASEAVPPGTRVFAFVPHQTRFRAPADEVHPVPDGVPERRAALFPYLETAVNLLLDGPPRCGDRVAVVGQGALGLALTALLSRYPLGGLVTVEPRRERRARSREFGASVSLSPAVGPERLRARLGGGAELVFEVSGSGAGVDLAVRLAAREGRVIAGSWLAGGPTPLDLGGWFHRGRVRIVSSQVSRMPALGPAWDVGRRRETAWSLLESVPLERLVDFETPFVGAAEAYAVLERGEAVAALLVGDSAGGDSSPVSAASHS